MRTHTHPRTRTHTNIHTRTCTHAHAHIHHSFNFVSFWLVEYHRWHTQRRARVRSGTARARAARKKIYTPCDFVYVKPGPVRGRDRCLCTGTCVCTCAIDCLVVSRWYRAGGFGRCASTRRLFEAPSL